MHRKLAQLYRPKEIPLQGLAWVGLTKYLLKIANINIVSVKSRSTAIMEKPVNYIYM